MNRRIVAGVASATVALAALAGCTTAPHENPADPAETTAPDFDVMDDRQAAALDGPLTIDAHVHADQVVIGDE